MVRLKNMSIGKQMVFLVVASGMIATGLGLLVIYHQGQANVWLMMEEQGKIVQAQTEVTRGYIAKNYVGKIKNSSVGSQITVATDHLDTPDAIPYPATSTREISAQLAATGIFSARLFSDRPINRDNLPNDAFEREALTAIMAGADSFARVEELNGVPTFRRGTPDKATVAACVGCHVGAHLGDVLGVLSVSMPMTAALAVSRTSLVRTGQTMVGVIAAIMIAMYFMLKLVVLRPLKAMTDISKDIAQGEGDLTKRVPVEGEDEIAHLGRWFNVFIEKLEGMIAKVTHVTNRVASSSVELSATADQMSRAAEALTTRTAQTAAAVEEMNATVGQVAQNSGTAAGMAQETVQTAQTGQGVVSETIDGMRQISESVSQSAKIISALGQSSDQIGEIVRTIEDIADQTNLLALNAAIEAARAGEQGRGFAVVADEVRKLAERTTKATKEIGDMIRHIQQDTRGAVASMEDGTRKVTDGVGQVNRTGEALGRIVEMVTKSADMIRQIAVAAEQQSVATQHISGDLDNVARVTKDTAGGAAESARASHDLNLQATELQTIVGSFKIASAEKRRKE